MTGEGGWRRLVEGYPWFDGAGRHPIPAYSEFMPAPRIGVNLFGEVDAALFDADDPYGWRVSEVEEAHEIGPGFLSIANQVMSHLLTFAANPAAVSIAGMHRRNLTGNRYWSPNSPHVRRNSRIGGTCCCWRCRCRRRRTIAVGNGRFRCERAGAGEAFWKSFYHGARRRNCRKANRSRVISRLLLDALWY